MLKKRTARIVWKRPPVWFRAALIPAKIPGEVAFGFASKSDRNERSPTTAQDSHHEPVFEGSCLGDRSSGRAQSPRIADSEGGGATTVPPAALEAVACLTSTQCVAVGGSRQIMVSSDGGQSWSARSDSDGHYLYGVACVSSTRCIAVGDAGTILISAKENQKWTSVGSGTTEPLSSVSCPGSGRCYAVGDGGTVLGPTIRARVGMTWHPGHR